jgi:hypothetical protein
MMSRISETASARAGSFGADDDGLRQLRQSIAESVMARMQDEIPGLSPHFGEDYEKSDDPEAIVYRSSGGSFRWLAFAFSPWRMWDLHVGVVHAGSGRLSVGFHISERAKPSLIDDLKRLADDIDAPVRHQKAAVEYQANLPLIDVEAMSLETLVDSVADLCRKYAPVAARVNCPAGMRGDAR